MSQKMPRAKEKVRHRARLIAANGDVSAACFNPPHAIDLRRASWTTRDEAVTCPRCRALAATLEPKEGNDV